MIEKLLDRIETKIDDAFERLKIINNRIEKLKEDMDGTRIPNHRNKNTK